MYYKIVPSDILITPAPADPYFRQAWAFCRAWAEGQPTFTLQTSGSTGTPKPIVLTRAQMQASAHSTQRALNLQYGQSALVCLNTAYIAGTMMLVRGMEIGLTLHIVPPSAQPFEGLPTELPIDFVALVPLQLQTLMGGHYQARLNACKTIIVGGAALPDSLFPSLRSLIPRVFSTYGMTETVSHVALQRLNGDCPDDGYRLLEGIEAETDVRGCLRLRGDVTAQVWVQTNDLIEWLQPRYFRILGRADNIINSGGIKIQLEKVEKAIETAGQIEGRFFAWWQPDETLGQRLILIIETGMTTSAEDGVNDGLKESLQNLLSPYEIPKLVYKVKKFAETPTGKIDKRATFVSIANQRTP